MNTDSSYLGERRHRASLSAEAALEAVSTVSLCPCAMEASVHWNKQVSIYSRQEKRGRISQKKKKALPLM